MGDEHTADPFDVVIEYFNIQTRPIPVNDRVARRFWSKVQTATGDGCWEWQGQRDRDGYGEFSIGTDIYVASRVAYTLKNGPIPDGMLVCHNCDNPPCVRPSHLRADYPTGNNMDKVRRNRHWYGIKVLTIDQRDQIGQWHTDGVSVHEIARRLGCSRKTVRYHIKLRDTNRRLRKSERPKAAPEPRSPKTKAVRAAPSPRPDCRAIQTRRCTKCEKTFGVDQFYPNKRKGTWYWGSWCKRCCIERNIERRRERRLEQHADP